MSSTQYIRRAMHEADTHNMATQCTQFSRFYGLYYKTLTVSKELFTLLIQDDSAV